MTRPFDNICPTCGAFMTFVRRRGSSEGSWYCPACRIQHGPRHQPAQEEHDNPEKDPGGRMGRAA